MFRNQPACNGNQSHRHGYKSANMTSRNSTDLVSILLPVGPKSLANEQSRSWLQESLDSLLRQSHQALEILIIGPDQNCNDNNFNAHHPASWRL